MLRYFSRSTSHPLITHRHATPYLQSRRRKNNLAVRNNNGIYPDYTSSVNTLESLITRIRVGMDPDYGSSAMLVVAQLFADSARAVKETARSRASGDIDGLTTFRRSNADKEDASPSPSDPSLSPRPSPRHGSLLTKRVC